MSSARDITLSVIVPSYNRKEEIRDLLTSLTQQSLNTAYFQVIIVDDGSTDGTKDFVEHFKQQYDLPVTLYTQDHQGPGAARNLGMQKATGDVFVFIDSDCTASPDWLQTIKYRFDQDPQVMAFGGRDDAALDFPPLLLAINYSMTSFLTTGGMRGGKKKRLAKFYPRSFNMGLHRDLYKQIGGFGGLRHGQDIEFSNRIIKSGEKVIYIPESVVYHKRRTSLTKFFRQVFNWGVARINLYKIDNAMLEPLHFAPAVAFWFVFIFTLLALLFRPVFSVWIVFAAIGVLALLVSAADAALKAKKFKTGLLTPIVMILQISGYGLGFTTAFVRRVIFKQGEFTGFVRRYYK